HIPFHLRHIVGSQRYSVPGLPCLYVGGSTLVCWRELGGTGDPTPADVYISRFKACDKAHLNVVNLGHRPALMAAYIANIQHLFTTPTADCAYVTAYATCWPLMAVCSIRRRQEGPFAPEYMIPKLVLQWITSTKQFDGIRYFSTRIDTFYDDPKTAM